MANTPHKGKTRHIAWLSSFLFKAQCFYRDEDDLAPDDKYYIRGERNALHLWFWQHFGRTITLAVFNVPAVSTESQVLYSFIIKVRMATPIFLYSYLLLIALYTNSIYIIWLKTYSVVFYFLNFYFVLRVIIFNSRFWYSLTGYIHQNHRHL